MPDSPFIPNSYQTPNAYCDDFMYLLDPVEWVVLSYAVRRIFGFQKRQDNISLSQFVHGTVSTKDGKPLDHGTGLSKPTVIRCLDSLIYYKFISKLADNDPTKNDGDLYALQLDYDLVDYDGLIERANNRVSADLKRTAAGRNSAASKRLSIPLPGQSDLPGEVVNPIDRGWSIPLTGGGQSDRPGVVNGIDTQYTVGNPEETKIGIVHKDFNTACARLKAAYPTDYAQAAPVLIEADEHPYRLHVRLEWITPDFIDRMSAALREVNPRRNYRLTYQTNGTGRPSEQGATEPAIAAPDPYAPTEAQLQLWHSVISELSFDAKPNTIAAYITPARPISINGSWTIAVPSPEWWQMNVKAVKRIYKALTGEATEFVFVEQRR